MHAVATWGAEGRLAHRQTSFFFSGALSFQSEFSPEQGRARLRRRCALSLCEGAP